MVGSKANRKSRSYSSVRIIIDIDRSSLRYLEGQVTQGCCKVKVVQILEGNFPVLPLRLVAHVGKKMTTCRCVGRYCDKNVVCIAANTVDMMTDSRTTQKERFVMFTLSLK